MSACARPACPEGAIPYGNGTLCLSHYRETLTSAQPQLAPAAIGGLAAVPIAALRVRLEALSGYELLAEVLDAALAQAQAGKGKERHAGEGEAFHDQKIVQLGEWMDSGGFAVGQACKKSLESTRLPYERARAELLGAINYLAAEVIRLDRKHRRSSP